MREPMTRLAGCTAIVLLATATTWGANPTQDELDFFESRIRPVLAEHCYACHNSHGTAEGELAVDHRDGLLKGGSRGPVILPREPTRSRLLAVLRHEIDDLEMPQDGAKLDARVIADFELWIARGAPDPRDDPPSAEQLATATTWETTLLRRKKWWSFQPIRNPAPPPSTRLLWSQHPIDRFVLKKLNAAGLEPTQLAEPATLVRRLYFNLIGLPPSRCDAERWTARIGAANGNQRDAVLGQLVDELLASPRFGERWARHWMDWIRYAESHGSEGDPEIVGAWGYRDYLIRALNADVPFDQLLREHVAGDLLETPRINDALGINESAIGPAHWRMVFHGFAPTDALDEKVRFTDDQVNVFSKAFLALTVSCARCHDHKFDAISQRDYYALFGVLASCRPGRTVVDLPDKVDRHRGELSSLKQELRAVLAHDWLAAASNLDQHIIAGAAPPDEPGKAESVLHPLFVVRQELADGADFNSAWQRRLEAFHRRRAQTATAESGNRSSSYLEHWKLTEQADYVKWFPSGAGLPDQPQKAGEFAVTASGENAITGIYPAGIYSHSLSAKHPARLTSPDIAVGEDNELWVRVIGDSGATVRYAVQDYPRRGTVYPVTKLTNQWRWQRYDLAYWSGDDIHIELATANDAPLLVEDQPRSWFGIREAVLLRRGQPPPTESAAHLAAVFDSSRKQQLTSVDELAHIYSTAIISAIEAWRENSATDEQAVLLDACLREGLLPNQLSSLPSAQPLIEEYRALEAGIPIPTRVPGVEETRGQNQPLFERGNHQLPRERVPRRFLEVIDPTPYETQLSGRRELAEDLLRQDNPLTKRVLVNRIWHHLFGQGIVSTPDNFGRLGDQPSHPELLDWLATRFEKEGWSLRRLVRLIVTSRTWQLSSKASARAGRIDPRNQLLSHANVRRLEAEAIRDLLLTVSQRMEHRLGGPPVQENSSRRSIYLRVRRNALNPFLRAFDFPEPFSAVGRRDVTNVPAQSLTMMNDARTSSHAIAWGQRVFLEQSLETDEQRVNDMFFTALGRQATAEEVERSLRYMAVIRQRAAVQRASLAELQRQVTDSERSITALESPVRSRLLEHDRALSPEESEVTAATISDSCVLAELTPAERSTMEQLREQIKTLEAEIRRLGPVPETDEDATPWVELARAIFTFKEFIYVR